MKFNPKLHRFTGEVRIPRSGEWFWRGGRFRDDEVLRAHEATLFEYPIIEMKGKEDDRATLQTRAPRQA